MGARREHRSWSAGASRGEHGGAGAAEAVGQHRHHTQSHHHPHRTPMHHHAHLSRKDEGREAELRLSNGNTARCSHAFVAALGPPPPPVQDILPRSPPQIPMLPLAKQQGSHQGTPPAVPIPSAVMRYVSPLHPKKILGPLDSGTPRQQQQLQNVERGRSADRAAVTTTPRSWSSASPPGRVSPRRGSSPPGGTAVLSAHHTAASAAKTRPAASPLRSATHAQQQRHEEGEGGAEDAEQQGGAQALPGGRGGHRRSMQSTLHQFVAVQQKLRGKQPQQQQQHQPGPGAVTPRDGQPSGSTASTPQGPSSLFSTPRRGGVEAQQQQQQQQHPPPQHSLYRPPPPLALGGGGVVRKARNRSSTATGALPPHRPLQPRGRSGSGSASVPHHHHHHHSQQRQGVAPGVSPLEAKDSRIRELEAHLGEAVRLLRHHGISLPPGLRDVGAPAAPLQQQSPPHSSSDSGHFRHPGAPEGWRCGGSSESSGRHYPGGSEVASASLRDDSSNTTRGFPAHGGYLRTPDMRGVHSPEHGMSRIPSAVSTEEQACLPHSEAWAERHIGYAYGEVEYTPELAWGATPEAPPATEPAASPAAGDTSMECSGAASAYPHLRCLVEEAASALSLRGLPYLRCLQEPPFSISSFRDIPGFTAEVEVGVEGCRGAAEESGEKFHTACDGEDDHDEEQQDRRCAGDAALRAAGCREVESGSEGGGGVAEEEEEGEAPLHFTSALLEVAQRSGDAQPYLSALCGDGGDGGAGGGTPVRQSAGGGGGGGGGGDTTPSGQGLNETRGSRVSTPRTPRLPVPGRAPKGGVAQPLFSPRSSLRVVEAPVEEPPTSSKGGTPVEEGFSELEDSGTFASPLSVGSGPLSPASPASHGCPSPEKRKVMEYVEQNLTYNKQLHMQTLENELEELMGMTRELGFGDDDDHGGDEESREGEPRIPTE